MDYHNHWRVDSSPSGVEDSRGDAIAPVHVQISNIPLTVVIEEECSMRSQSPAHTRAQEVHHGVIAMTKVMSGGDQEEHKGNVLHPLHVSTRTKDQHDVSRERGYEPSVVHSGKGSGWSRLN
eukprot:6487087-Amphidinium_carterae.6